MDTGQTCWTEGREETQRLFALPALLFRSEVWADRAQPSRLSLALSALAGVAVISSVLHWLYEKGLENH